MKSKIFIIFSIFILALSSCNIDEKVYIPVEEGFITDSTDVAFLVNGVYSGLCSRSLYKDLVNRIAIYGHDVFAVTNSTYQAYPKRSFQSSDANIGSAWGEYYRTIKNVNTLIKDVAETDMIKDTYKARILGEMYFIRAFCYYDLVRTFGEVPLRTKAISVGDDFYLPASSIDDVYKQIFEDLKFAEENCITASRQPANEKGRANQGAAQAMIASAALTYANHLEKPNDSKLPAQPERSREYYKMAAEYADKVIKFGGYALLDDYASLFVVTGEAAAYKEVIFAVQFAADTKASSASSRGSEVAFYTQPTTRFNICGNVTDKKGGSITKIQAWFYDLCTTGDYGARTSESTYTDEIDYRSQVNFLTKWKDGATENLRITYPRVVPEETLPVGATTITAENYPYLDKYKDPNGLQSLNNGNDLYIYRLAEMYLIKAEALNEYHNGPTIEAYEALEAVRARARKKSGNKYPLKLEAGAGLSKEDFRMKIWDERGLEFLGEPKRHFDLIRMKYKDNKRTMIEYIYGEFYPKMPQTVYRELTYSTATHTYNAGRVNLASIAPYSKRFLIWPLPISETTNNPNVKQNPEYGW